MALIACADCSTEVSDQAPACLKCGRPIAGRTTTPDPPLQQEPETEAGIYVLFGAAVLIGLTALWGAGWFSTPKTETDPEPVVLRLGDQRHGAPVSPTNVPEQPGEPAGAWVACKGFVEDRLKSPGSASFPWYSDGKAIHQGGGRYEVHSYVDSQNGFGALIRTNFDCRVSFESGYWKLDSLKMAGR
jgi:hypothetical protein